MKKTAAVAAPLPLPLTRNSRFYVLSFVVLASLFAVCFLRIVIPTEQLWTIRAEQVLGLGALLLWYSVLLVSPLQRLIGQATWFAHVLYNRRALGVGVAWLALLHAVFTVWGQLDGFAGIAVLPPLFMWALVAGLVGLLILLAMTAVSIDLVVKKFPKATFIIFAKLSYLAVVVTLLHIWIIGTHVSITWLQWLSAVLLVGLFSLQAGASVKKRVSRGSRKKVAWACAAVVWVVLIAALFGMRKFVPSYTTEHKGHAGQLGADSHEHN